MNAISRSVLARYRIQGVCRACGRKALPEANEDGVCSVPAMCIGNRGIRMPPCECRNLDCRECTDASERASVDADRDEIERRKDLDQQRRDALDRNRFRGKF